MPQSEISTWLQFSLQQMAAESYLDGIDLNIKENVKIRLRLGNNRSGFPESGATRFTGTQTQGLQDQAFVDRYQIVDHHANDATGFSATLIKDLSDPTGKTFTLSFRSLEYQNQVDGGDWERDGLSGAAGEIAGTGFALAQLVSMERYYRELKADPSKLPLGAILNVTGYSLGGHLATVFTQLHANEVAATYTFNGAGRGGINGGTSGLSETERIREMLQFAEEQMLNWDPTGDVFRSGNGGNIYHEQWYEGVWGQTVFQFQPTSSFLPPGQIGSAPGFEKITQLVGQATHNDQPYVANSGIHGHPTTIFIEDQPNVDGLGGLFHQSGSFGTTHSITLLVDSLALMELFQQVDGTLEQTTIEGIFAAASNQTGSGIVGLAGLAEGNSLENALDVLGKIVVLGYTPTSFGRQTNDFGSLTFRNPFYANLEAVRAAVSTQTYQIASFATKSSSEIYAAARNADPPGLAYRYALQALNPFAVVGADYTTHNPAGPDGGPLDLYDAQTGRGTWTALALIDRAELLAKRLAYNLSDGGEVPTDTHFQDLQTGFEAGSTSSTNEVIFGDDRVGDVLSGHTGDDHLYGRDGADTIEGHEGRDYIEGGLGNDPLLSGGPGNDIILGQQDNDNLDGGADNDRLNGGLGDDRLDGGTGLDTYVYRTGQGNDRIVDADKIGTIIFDNQTLVGGVRRQGAPVNTYTSPDVQFIYVKSGTSLIINNTLTIENFDFINGALGIKLADTGDLASPDLPVQGPVTRIWTGTAGGDDLGAVPFQDNHFITGGFGNDYIDGWTGDDQLYGEGDNDFILGGQGRDALYGGDGLDRLEGDGTTNALPAAGGVVLGLPDQDYLDGGAGDDVLLGYDYGDVLLGGEGADQLLGDDYPAPSPSFNDTYPVAQGGRPVGADYLDGGAGDDLLFAGLGDDVLLGGDGNDEMRGDNVRAGGWYDFGFFALSPPVFNPTGRLARFTAEGGADYLDGGAGNDILIGDGGDDILLGGAEHDFLFGDDLSTNTVIQGTDWLEGGAGDDQLMGGGGADALFGGDGTDLLVGDFADNPTAGADDTLDGGAGDDQLLGGGGHDLLEGGLGDDLLIGDDGEDSLFGGEGLDQLEGALGNDVLDGEAGDDLIFGGDGIDVLFGGEGMDELQGGDGDDELAGEAGDDFLLGDAGQDVLFGDDGADRLQGGAGDDLIGGDAGNDGLFGEDGADTLFGDSGNDELLGGVGNDVLSGGIGNDYLDGEAGDNILFGDEGIDALIGGSGQDILDGGTGNDRLLGGAGRDTYAFNLGNGLDTVEETIQDGNNVVSFGAGITSDSISLGLAQSSILVRIGNSGDALQIFGFGVDTFQFADGSTLTYDQLLARGFNLPGTAGNDVITGTDVSDLITGGAGDDTLSGMGGADALQGDNGADFLRGGTGDDLLQGGADDDQVMGEEGNDVLEAGTGADTLDGGEGNDLLRGGSGNDGLIGGPGDDTYELNFGDGTDRIFDLALPGEGNRIMFGAGFSADAARLSMESGELYVGFTNTSDAVSAGSRDEEDIFGAHAVENFEFSDGTVQSYEDLITALAVHGVEVVGTPDDDFLMGTTIRDRFVGGAGNDELFGGIGDDEYLFNLGDGVDIIDDIAAPGEENVIVFGPGIGSTDLRLDVASVPFTSITSLLLHVGNDGDALQFITFDPQNVFGPRAFETLRFSDGDTLTYDQLLARGFDLIGTAGDDQLNGTHTVDRLTGADGADVLRSSAGEDTLDGGLGDDRLIGGQGNDTYLFGPGSGHDMIVEAQGALDTIRMAPGVTPSGVVATRSNLDLVLGLNGGADQLTVSLYFAAPSLQIERILFDDGTIWDQTFIDTQTQSIVTGTTGSDALVGTTGDDSLAGLAGDDQLTGLAGHDLLDGGTGTDQLTGGLGNDTYIVDEMGDVVTELTNEGTDTIQSVVSRSLETNVENLALTGTVAINATGNALDNILTGNSAANVLTGGLGNDTYVAGPEDTIVEAVNEGIDTLLSAATTTLGTNLENLTLTGNQPINGMGNALGNILIGNQGVNILAGGAGNDTYVIDTIDQVVEQANEGIDTIQSVHTVHLGANVEHVTLLGDEAVEGIGNELANILTGNLSSNLLEGREGTDRLDGGGGADTLVGGSGQDVYVFRRGAGFDVIQDTVLGEKDTIELGLDVAPGDIRVALNDASELFLEIRGTSDRLTLRDYAPLNSDDQATKEVRFADGTVWDGATLASRIESPPSPNPGRFFQGTLENDVLVGTDGDDFFEGLAGGDLLDGLGGDDFFKGYVGNDTILGGDGNDTIYADWAWIGSPTDVNDTLRGGAGNDFLYGEIGSDLLDGGPGNDWLDGGDGVDTYLFGRGYGTDQIITYGGVDRILMTPDVSPADVIVSGGSGGLILRIVGTSDQLFAPLIPDDPFYRIGSVEFSDGTVWTQAMLLDMTLTIRGTNFADSLFGTSRSETFIGGLGDDTYVRADATDTLVELAGEGTDTIMTASNYTIPDDFENLSLQSTANVGTGNRADNFITGTGVDNTLDGREGNDTLIGGSVRVDEGGIAHGDGSDILLGGAGDDRLILSFGFFEDGRNYLGQDVFGDDVLIGGLGNDTYVLYNSEMGSAGASLIARALVVESVDEGSDTVIAASDYTLGVHVENLMLIGDDSLALRGLGNADGNVLTGSAGENLLEGLGGSDTLIGSGSDDRLHGGVGYDTYVFNVGDGLDTILDTATAGEGNRIQFGTGIAQSDLTFTHDDVARTLMIQVGSSGADQLVLTNFDPTGANGSMVVETLAFADGSTASLAMLLGLGGPVATNGDDTVNTGAGSDTVMGGTGNDQLIGGAGDDTYLFNPGDGVDTITDTAAPGEGNTLEFGTGVAPTDLSLGVGSLLIRVGENGDAIHLTNFDPANVLGPRTIESFRFADGTVLSYDQLIARGFDLTGTAGHDTITGTNVVDRINGLAGDDTIQAGAGDDLLNGGAGGDTYMYNLGDGLDTIDDKAAVGAGNRVQFGTGISQAGLTFTRDEVARTLTIDVGGSEADKLVLTNFDPTGANGSHVVETLAFTDGSSVNLVDLYPPNHSPTVTTPLADQTVSEDVPLSLVVPANTFADQDAADVLTYSASLVDGTALPVWLNFDATTATFSGTPDDAQVGTLDLNVTATDSGTLSVSDVFTLTVTNVNEAPTVAMPLADQQATEDASFNFMVPANIFADADHVHGDQLAYRATLSDGSALPSWLNFDSATRTFSGTPLNGDVGILNINVTVTDGGALSVTDSFALTIQNANDGPTVAAPFADQTAAEDSAFIFTVSSGAFTDEDLIHGDVLTYSATLADGSALPTWLGFDPTTRTFSGTPGAADAGSIQIAVTATDAEALSGTALFTVNVTRPLPQTAVGTTGNDVLTGGRGDDTLSGLAGHDLLDGDEGSDRMLGGAGSDIYVVDASGDVVTELPNEGFDTVIADITTALSANVEALVLTGSSAIDGTGNSLNNGLTGNNASNTLDGGSGADVMAGLDGDDTYIVDRSSDLAVELANHGIDTVQSAVTYALAANLEHLTLTGAAAINGTGNALDNILVGNSAVNRLTGGVGNDTYVVGAGDTVVESSNSGADIVHSSFTWTLGSNLEHLTLTGSSAINGTGNSAANVLTGNSANNVLSGANGADSLRGGLSNDTVNGGGGNDTFLFGRGDGQDLVQDNSGAADKLLYDAGINPLDLVISRQANDLRVAIHGSPDQVTVQNWYTGTSNRIETLQAGNGQTLLSTQVDQLIQAMAGFTAQTGLTWDQAIDQRPQEVQAVLAASWQ
jgi:Ca2+-binding RTX toxin-like protein